MRAALVVMMVMKDAPIRLAIKIPANLVFAMPIALQETFNSFNTKTSQVLLFQPSNF